MELSLSLLRLLLSSSLLLFSVAVAVAAVSVAVVVVVVVVAVVFVFVRPSLSRVAFLILRFSLSCTSHESRVGRKTAETFVRQEKKTARCFPGTGGADRRQMPHTIPVSQSSIHNMMKVLVPVAIYLVATISARKTNQIERIVGRAKRAIVLIGLRSVGQYSFRVSFSYVSQK
jgi:hypothetical protein